MTRSYNYGSLSQATFPPTDPSTEAGAKKLAQRIRDYWADRGCEVEVTPTLFHFTPKMRANHWHVRSDLKNGLPRDFRGKA